MLIKLEIENFRSFNQKQVFHTVQRNLSGFVDHVFRYNEDLTILKTSAIYGGNASGKTNLFRSLEFVKMMVQTENFMQTSKGRNFLFPFLLDTDPNSRDTTFKVDFICQQSIYIYELHVHKKSKRVVYERLSILNKVENTLLFERNTNLENVTNLSVPISDDEKFIKTVSNVLKPFTTLLNSGLLNDTRVAVARDWFIDKLRFQTPEYDSQDIAYVLSLKDEYLILANKILEFANVGIHKLKIARYPIEVFFGNQITSIASHIIAILDTQKFYTFEYQGSRCTAVRDIDNKVSILKLTTTHLDKQGNEVVFEPDQESRGTIAFFHLLPALILSYEEGVNYFVDEIGASLHPILIKEILSQYLTHNISKAKGQLIFNTHEDYIMDAEIVRQDEIWLVDKTSNGETRVFPLTDIHNGSTDRNLHDNYLNGKYGGVPYDKKPNNLIFDVTD